MPSIASKGLRKLAIASRASLQAKNMQHANHFLNPFANNHGYSFAQEDHLSTARTAQLNSMPESRPKEAISARKTENDDLTNMVHGSGVKQRRSHYRGKSVNQHFISEQGF